MAVELKDQDQSVTSTSGTGATLNKSHLPTKGTTWACRPVSIFGHNPMNVSNALHGNLLLRF